MGLSSCPAGNVLLPFALFYFLKVVPFFSQSRTGVQHIEKPVKRSKF